MTRKLETEQFEGPGTVAPVPPDITVPVAAPIPTQARGKRGLLSPRMRRFISAVLSLVVVGILWQIIGGELNPLYISQPTHIWSAFTAMVSDGTLGPAIWATLKPLLLGYAIAAVIGIPFGLLLGRYRWFEAVLGMYVTAGYATPLVAIIPLFVLWFGLGFTVKVVVVVALAVFPIIINTWSGAKLVPKTLIDVGKSFVASGPTVMRKIIIPSTLPEIMTGLRLGVGRAVIAVVIAEFFTALDGLGEIIIKSGERFDTPSLMVPIIIMLMLGVGLTSLLSYFERKVAPWQSGLSGHDDGR